MESGVMSFFAVHILALFLLLVTVFCGSTPTYSTSSSLVSCITTTPGISDGDIYTPENPLYSWVLNSTIRNLMPLSLAGVAKQKPLLIVKPRHESQIQSTIRCCRESGVQLRVRSGGHDYEGLSYTSQVPFVMVDMRNLRSVSVDIDSKTAWVQSGATLGELYYAIAQRSRTLGFPAGDCPTVGVGGHLSGGGYSMMSRRHGLAADHITDAILINARGQVLDRGSMGEDLFWAIRGGGGGSFGIVVTFKVTLVVVPEIVTVFNVTRTLEENSRHIVNRWQRVAAGENSDDNLTMRVFLNNGEKTTNGGHRTVAASFRSLFLGRAGDLVSMLQQGFPELGLRIEDCTELSWIESVLFFADKDHLNDLLSLDLGHQVIFSKAKSDYVMQPIPADDLVGILDFFLEQDNINGDMQLTPYGGRINQISETETPFPHRAGTLFLVHYSVYWWIPADRTWHMDWIRRLYDYMTPYVSKSPRGAYVNYRDLDLGVNDQTGGSCTQGTHWGFRYFKANFNRLVRVKTLVDPTNFFWNEQSVPTQFQCQNLRTPASFVRAG